ncbi:MAG: lysozyme [Bacteroides sp.]|nr:lysozyme [Bacteroides sp.]
MMLAIAGASFCGWRNNSSEEKPAMVAMASPAVSEPEVSPFEQAVEIIKKYEGLHSARHWPLVGYGHKVLPGEKFNRNRPLSEVEAEALLRKDLLKNCAVFREFGADSLLLGVLAYNIGSGATLRSSVVKKLREGDRNIEANYLAHCKYRGKEHSQIKRRRTEEFETLFMKEVDTRKIPEVDFALSNPATANSSYPGLNNNQNL